MPRLEGDPCAFPAVLAAGRPMSLNKTAAWRSLRPVIDAARCTKCLLCWKFCPEACVILGAGVPLIALDHCKGCGVCAAECPPKCIALEAEAAP